MKTKAIAVYAFALFFERMVILTNYSVKYPFGVITYYFRTERRKNKFERRLQEIRNSTSERLSVRYRMRIDIPIIADMYWYRECEPQYFKIEYCGRVFNTWEGLLLTGGILTERV